MHEIPPDALWCDEVMYTSRAFAAWYTATHAYDLLLDPALAPAARPRYVQLVSDACWALGQLTPVPAASALHRDLHDLLTRAQAAAMGQTMLSGEVAEELHILGVTFMQEMRRLNIGTTMLE